MNKEQIIEKMAEAICDTSLEEMHPADAVIQIEAAKAAYEAAGVDELRRLNAWRIRQMDAQQENMESMQETKNAMSSKLQELQALVRELGDALQQCNVAFQGRGDDYFDEVQVEAMQVLAKIPTELKGE